MGKNKSKKIVFLDSSVILLIYAAPEQQNNEVRERAKFLFSKFEKNEEEYEILLPSIVLAEMMCKGNWEQESRDEFHSILCSKYRIIPFDAIAAKIYGEIWEMLEDYENFKAQKKGKAKREKLKTDLKILATCISFTKLSSSVDKGTLYLNDNKFYKISKQLDYELKVRRLPNPHGSLFERQTEYNS